MMFAKKQLFLGICLGLFFSHTAIAIEQCQPSVVSNTEPVFAQCGPITYGDTLNVAVRHAPPFVYEEIDVTTGEPRLTGIAIDFWERVAREIGADYQYVCKGLSDTLQLLESGGIDMAVSPLTITRSREQAFDFSHQYFNSGLVFASSPNESSFNFDKAFNTLSNTLASTNVFYLLMFFVVLFLVLILLALKNIRHYQTMPAMIDKTKPAMLMHVVLYSILNIVGIRKDVFGFSSVGMQLFSFLILIFGITVSASLLSLLTAALTQSVAPKTDFSIETMDQHKLVTLRGSTAQGFLCDSRKQPLAFEVTDTWTQSLEQVAEGKRDLVLGDWVQLVYLSQKSNLSGKITVHDQSFKFEPYGWGFTTDHPIKDRVNQELIGILRSQAGIDIVKKYIGDQQISMQVK
ncbi:extracellular solute-binding protein, family 3 [gamma proteobacterium IMCC1989]|nr:extracellular solute-binding protein, family 3 [gamma proteobacterium IMCC1989]